MNNLIKNVGIDQTYPMYIDNNLLEKSHCILGISPFNSFFFGRKYNYIDKLGKYPI